MRFTRLVLFLSFKQGVNSNMHHLCGLIIAGCFLCETFAEKNCWYLEDDYPVYFTCGAHDDCCGTQCCISALAIQRIWYFWFLLLIGILCCCSTGYFIRRRIHTYRSPEVSDLSVLFTRHPIVSPGVRQAGFPSYGDLDPAGISTSYPAQTRGHVTAVYYSHPPPPYEQVIQDSQKK